MLILDFLDFHFFGLTFVFVGFFESISRLIQLFLLRFLPLLFISFSSPDSRRLSLARLSTPGSSLEK